MPILCLELSFSLHQRLVNQAIACGELWNIAMMQRRNKYSWGKANAETQIMELKSLQSLDPQFEAVPYCALQQVIIDLDTAYADFLQAKDAFKRHQREKMPVVPALKTDGFLYPVFYDAPYCKMESADSGFLVILSSSIEDAKPFKVFLSVDQPLDISKGVWLLPEKCPGVRLYIASSKEAGRMALKDANSTNGTEISGSSPNG